MNVGHNVNIGTVVLVVLQIATGVIVAFLAYFQHGLRSYAAKKGENLATREDVADITRRVEEVKTEYAKQLLALEHAQKLVLEQSDKRHQLSLAAIDRRLQAHQDAFAKCYDLMRLATDRSPEGTDKLNDVLQWFRENCLYLSPDAARAFSVASGAAGAHRSLLEAGGAGSQLIQDNWKNIMQAFEVIAAAVKLPEFGAEIAKSPESNPGG